MIKRNIFFLTCFLLVLIPIVDSQEGWVIDVTKNETGKNGNWIVETEIPSIPVNYSLVNVNNSQFFQGYTPTALKDWIQGLFDSVYCKLTGCDMTGDLSIKSSGHSSTPLRVENSATTNDLFRIYQDADGDSILYLYDKAGNVKARIWTAGTSYITGGNFGLGTSTFDFATSGLEVRPSSQSKFGVLVTNSTGGRNIGLYTTSTGYGGLYLYENTGDIGVNFLASGNSFVMNDFGIGISPNTRLHLHQPDGALANYVRFSNADTGSTATDGVLVGLTGSEEDLLIWNYENTNIRFAIGGDEKVRIDTSGNVNVTKGNITSSNVFIPQYIFTHTNENISVIGASAWTNITFQQEATDIRQGISHTGIDNTNHTFTIMQDGIYNIDYDFDVEDTSAGASDVDIAGRLIYLNGTEVIGSVFETDITKQGTETELSHNFLASFTAGDVLIFQFVGTDSDVKISTHGTFGDHSESATILMMKIANLP